MKSIQLRHSLTAGFAFVAGASLLLYLTHSATVFEVGRFSGPALAVWLVLIAVGALSPLPLGRGDGTLSLTAALDIAAVLLFGPAGACWIATLSRLIQSAVEGWNPMLPGISRLGEAMLAVGVTGIVYQALGGKTGAGLVVDRGQVIAIPSACGVYLLLKHGLSIALLQEQWRRAKGDSVFRRFVTTFPGDLIITPFGVLLAYTQSSVGALGVALFLVPLLLARYYFNHWIDTKRHLSSIMRTMMATVDAADPLTWGHSDRISRMAVSVGRKLGMSKPDLEDLENAALLHDIGRTAILREVLTKPGKLSTNERSALLSHPTIGRDIVDGFHLFGAAAEIVHAHHEQPDGKGYPRGLAGDEIPLGSKILMAVAAFDAMTSDRPYRQGLSPEAAIEELLAHSGTQFHPAAVEALIQRYSSGELFADFPEDQLAMYENGRGSSRALAEYLAHRSVANPVPEKCDATVTSDEAPARHPAVLELPASVATAESQTLRVRMGGHAEAWLDVVGRSDVGRVRNNNEDSMILRDYSAEARGCLLLVADGMGGAAAGEVASRLAVEVIESVYSSSRSGNACGMALERAIKAANGAVYACSHADSAVGGMGTTCAAAIVAGGELYVSHVGDSRVYVMRSGALEQITQDHSLAAELVATGNSASQGSHHLLTRSLGAQDDVEVDTIEDPIHLEAGSVILLCTDGLTNMIEDHELQEILSSEPPAEAAETLIELARERGGPDNITVVVARLDAGSAAA